MLKTTVSARQSGNEMTVDKSFERSENFNSYFSSRSVGLYGANLAHIHGGLCYDTMWKKKKTIAEHG